MTESRPSQRRVDPRDPFVLDLRALGRRPGSLRRVRRAVPAPTGYGLELIGVPAGAELDLDLRLEAVMEGVLVSGTVTAPLVGECGRCLDPISDTLVTDLQELYVYPDRELPEDADEAEESVRRVEVDHLDLGPVVRDAVVLDLPLTPLCRDDCAGLCPGCGARLDEVPPDHAHDQLDPRWAVLGDWQGDRSG